MEEGIGIVWAIIVVIFSIVSAVSKNKKNRQQAQKTQNAPPVQPVPQAAPAEMKHTAPVAAHTAAPLETHMHIPFAAMGQEGVGSEGIDCCHEYMLTDQPAEAEESILPLGEGTEKERAQALLQGVIFSEILGRRNVRRYGGQKA